MPFRACALVLSITCALAAADPRRVWEGSASAHLGGPSSDGAAFSCVDPATGDLALRDLATGRMRRLTAKSSEREFAYFSVISRDDKQVAYAWFNDAGFYDLRVVPLDGSPPKVLYRNEEAGFVQPTAWSPDGEWILTLLFRKDNISQIAMVRARDGEVRVLKSLNWVYPKKMDFSPDGRFIVYDSFARDGASQRDLFVLTVDGSQESRLVESPAEDLFPVWSPRGDRIYFASDRAGSMDLWSVPVKDGRATAAPERVRRDLGRLLPMGITRKGELMYALRTGASELWLADWDEAAAKFTSRPARLGEGMSPTWSPDGQRLAWLVRRGAENFGREARGIVIREAGKDRALAPKLAHMESIQWSAAGQTLLVSGSDGKGRGGVFRVDSISGAVTPIDMNADAPYQVWPAAEGATLWIARGLDLISAGKTVHHAAAPIESLAVSGDRVAWIEQGQLHILGKSTPSDAATALVWSGSHILAVRGSELWKLSPDAPAERVARLAADVSALSIAKGRIAFSAGRPRSEVWMVEVEK